MDYLNYLVVNNSMMFIKCWGSDGGLSLCDVANFVVGTFVARNITKIHVLAVGSLYNRTRPRSDTKDRSGK